MPNNNLMANAIGILNKSENGVLTLENAQTHAAVACASSAFSEAIIGMNIKNRALTEAKLELYKKLAANESASVMLEAFSDYYVQAMDIINEFARFMQDKFNFFIDRMESYTLKDDYIEDHKDALKDKLKFYEDGGSKRGYIFTIRKDIPNITALNQFDVNLFNGVVNAGTNDLSVQSMKQATEAIDLEVSYKQFRAAVLGRDGEEVSENAYTDELYKVFRNNNLNEEALKITTQSVKNMVELWFGFKDVKKSLKSDLDGILQGFNSILDNISKATKNNYGMTVSAFTKLLPGDVNAEYIDGKELDNYAKEMPGDLMLQFDVYCKIKLDQLQKYSDIICLAFSAKMDAVKAMYNQNRLILHDVCRAIDSPEYQQHEYGMKSTEGPKEDNPDVDPIKSVMTTKSDGVEP